MESDESVFHEKPLNLTKQNSTDTDLLLDEEVNPNVIKVFNRTNKINNKLRKNDAVKIITTPNGKVGIVYQSTKNKNNENFVTHNDPKPISEDQQQQQPQFVNRNANDVRFNPEENRATPVLTSDGKVALLYRGGGESGRRSNNSYSGNLGSFKKYEPITNLSSILTSLNGNDNKINSSISLGEKIVTEAKDALIEKLDEFMVSVEKKVKHIEEVIEHREHATATTSTEAPDQGDNDLLKQQSMLMNNRPLSEVLGIKKKTYFYHHPHSTDASTTNHHEPTRRTTVGGNTHFEQMPTMDTNAIFEDFDTDNSGVINVAIIPGFDRELEERLFGKSRHNTVEDENAKSNAEGDDTLMHCAMQLMLVISCVFVFFGLVGAFYKVHIVNQIRIMYW